MNDKFNLTAWFAHGYLAVIAATAALADGPSWALPVLVFGFVLNLWANAPDREIW